MSINYKEIEIDGVKVKYVEHPGLVFSRYAITMKINDTYINDKLVCPPTSLLGRLEELVFMNKLMRRD